MKFMRKVVFVVVVLSGNIFISQAQSISDTIPDTILNNAKECLRQGKIEDAKKFYNVYKNAYKPDSDFEEQLQKYTLNNDTTSLTFDVDGVTFRMVCVEGGKFKMGGTVEQGGDVNAFEKPVHPVILSDFYIGQFEVTQKLWNVVMGTTIEQQRDKENPNLALYGVGPNYPMYYVSWEEAMAFCQELSRMTGKKFCLPTEAQWEYAARGGNKSEGSKYSGGWSIDKVAFYESNSNYGTQLVGQKSPNELGIYDMSGNVWEWCRDWMGNYSVASQKNPGGPENGSYRILRGGGWNNRAKSCRVSNRGSNEADGRHCNNGFRIVLLNK